MSNECLVAEFSNAESLNLALEVLEKAGYSRDQVSIVSTPDQVERYVPHDSGSNVDAPPAEKTTGASTLAGGAVGAILGAGTMIGPLLVAGPIVGMAVGAAGGGLLSAVGSLSISKDDASRYERNVATGASLVVVMDDSIKLNDAERGLKTCDPVSLERYDVRQD
ncbi:MAG: DUF1269 domain-containing protein [Rhodopirellula sp. JB044]|uniref:DUF1269 domain-containing protein n=1 Tax=Rhodopirellula sp. JB044 TaxID=3342844 RepID=UPI00370B6A3B